MKDLIIIKNYKPEKFSTYIERISFGYAKTEINHLQIPLPFHPWVIPLNHHGLYYNDEHITSPVLQNINLTSSRYVIPKGSKMLLVRFYPSCFYPFWNLNIKKHIATPDFSFDPKSKDDPETYFPQIYSYLEEKFSQTNADEIAIIKDLYSYVIDNPEKSTLESFCDDKQINYMFLYRLFGKILSLTPKKFVRLTKFRVANHYLFHSNKNLTNVGFNSGYYDQPHFVKEFKHFVGINPKEYLQIIKQNPLYSSSSFSNFSSLL